MLEFQIHSGLAIEADGIYRPLHFRTSNQYESVREAILTWEFPVVAKYKFRRSRQMRPFAELGPSFRLSGNLHGGAPSPWGVTTGAGVEARISRLKIAPALRYTRWAQGAGIPVNRWEVLVGFYL
jgi:hypothetical protein